MADVPTNAMTRAGDHQRGRDHRDAGALRRRDAMGRPRIRRCERVLAAAVAGLPSDEARQQRRRCSSGKRQAVIANWPFCPTRKTSAYVLTDYFGTSIGAAPCAAFSALKIRLCRRTRTVQQRSIPIRRRGDLAALVWFSGRSGNTPVLARCCGTHEKRRLKRPGQRSFRFEWCLPRKRCRIRRYWLPARRVSSAFMSPVGCWPKAATWSVSTISTAITIRR